MRESDIESLQVELDPSGNLTLLRDGARVTVTLRPCFPWSQPEGFLSLPRQRRGRSGLSTKSRRTRDGGARSGRGGPQSIPVYSRNHRYRIRANRFRTPRLEGGYAPRESAPSRPVSKNGRWNYPIKVSLSRDLAGDLYHIPDPKRLDRKSYTRLWAFIE